MEDGGYYSRDTVEEYLGILSILVQEHLQFRATLPFHEGTGVNGGFLDDHLWRTRPRLVAPPQQAMRSPSMNPISRQSLCKNAVVMLLGSSFFPERRGGSALTAASMGMSLSVSDGVQVLWKYCPDEFLRAVKESQRFLYRGESADISSPVILNPRPDLLDPGTYDDPAALHYFEWLEQELTALSGLSTTQKSSLSSFNGPGKRSSRLETVSEIARPSRGHIGTSDERVALNWGTPVSVWPLGESFSYVWPRNRPLLFPGGGESLDDLVINKDLDIALSAGREVLFSTSSDVSELDVHGPAYLAFPKSLEPELRDQLRAIRYGLTG